MSEPFSLQDFLAQQRAEYRASLPDRLAQLQAAWTQVRACDTDAAARHALERCAHGLAGSAATFGFAALGDAARPIEEALAAEAAGHPSWNPASAARVAPLVDALSALLRAAIEERSADASGGPA